ncbi:hypothetical protein ACFWPH_32470 [Nocardia sp. NPDC058499]|uniref:hypothetical protein n=1 Tax=Nocardia sp. NPDC058499 TaxID=3346530 RepID=UPI003656EEA1
MVELMPFVVFAMDTGPQVAKVAFSRVIGEQPPQLRAAAPISIMTRGVQYDR